MPDEVREAARRDMRRIPIETYMTFIRWPVIEPAGDHDPVNLGMLIPFNDNDGANHDG